jgi:transcription elongation GreA/GreB family factor
MHTEKVITPLGRVLLERRQAQLEKVILESQERLAELNHGDPGEGYQDGYLLDSQMNVQMLEQRLRDVKELLRGAQLAQRPQQANVIALGHRVHLSLTYPSGESEELTVVLLPSQELSLVEEELENGEVPVSPISALGTAILGQKVGSTFQYGVNHGTVQGKVLGIGVWHRAFEPASLPTLQTTNP